MMGAVRRGVLGHRHIECAGEFRRCDAVRMRVKEALRSTVLYLYDHVVITSGPVRWGTAGTPLEATVAR